MPTPIEEAREALYTSLTALPAIGLNADYADILLKRLLPNAAPILSMDPDAVDGGEQPPLTLAYRGAKVKVPNLVTATVLQKLYGENVATGDLVVRLVRIKAVEDFLGMVLDDAGEPTGEPDAPGRPYPQLARFLLELNGLDYKPLRANPGTMYLELTVRRIQ